MFGTAVADNVTPGVANTLIGNSPKPFNPGMVIFHSIKDACLVHLENYNLKGQKVRTLVNPMENSEQHRISFDGKDDAWRALASGIYFSFLQAGSYRATHKIMLWK